jgi:hypothetical protein
MSTKINNLTYLQITLDLPDMMSYNGYILTKRGNKMNTILEINENQTELQKMIMRIFVQYMADELTYEESREMLIALGEPA